MKCLLNLFLEGKLVDSLDPKYLLLVKINEQDFYYGVSSDCESKIGRNIVVWDPHPEWYACFIELILMDVSSKNPVTRKTDEQIIGTFKYTFTRKLNQKMTVYPDCILGKYLKHSQIEATCSDFIIPIIDHIMGESTLNMVVYPDSLAGPVFLSKYFEDFNHDQIELARLNKDKWVILLKIHHSIGSASVFVVYYHSIIKPVSDFPVMIQDNDIIKETVNKSRKIKKKKKKIDAAASSESSFEEKPSLIDLN